MHCIKEVEIGKSVDEHITSPSSVERNDFTDYGRLDAMIASALKRLLDKHIHFRQRVSVEEQRAQKYERFLRGRQIAFMIYEHFRATGAHEAVQRDSDLFSIRLQHDDVQDFDVRWDQALLFCKRHAFRCDPGRTLFGFRPSWLCTIKKPLEIMDRQVIYD